MGRCSSAWVYLKSLPSWNSEIGIRSYVYTYDTQRCNVMYVWYSGRSLYLSRVIFIGKKTKNLVNSMLVNLLIVCTPFKEKYWEMVFFFFFGITDGMENHVKWKSRSTSVTTLRLYLLSSHPLPSTQVWCRLFYILLLRCGKSRYSYRSRQRYLLHPPRWNLAERSGALLSTSQASS